MQPEELKYEERKATKEAQTRCISNESFAFKSKLKCCEEFSLYFRKCECAIDIARHYISDEAF